jgi:hypothetical protein
VLYFDVLTAVELVLRKALQDLKQPLHVELSRQLLLILVPEFHDSLLHAEFEAHRLLKGYACGWVDDHSPRQTHHHVLVLV